MARLEGTDAAQCGLQSDAHAPNRAGDVCLFNNTRMSRGGKALFSRQLRRECGWEGARPHSRTGYHWSYYQLSPGPTQRLQGIVGSLEHDGPIAEAEMGRRWCGGGREVKWKKSRWTDSRKKTRFKTEWRSRQPRQDRIRQHNWHNLTVPGLYRCRTAA